MNRFAAWTMGEPIDDRQGRYRIFYGKAPRSCAVDAIWFTELCIQDADDPPLAGGGARARWDEFVAEHDAWLRTMSGRRVHGWGKAGNGRWAVDLSRQLPWDEVVRECERMALNNGAYGLHLDDLSLRPFWTSVHPVYDPALYAAHVIGIARALESPDVSGSGWKAYNSTPTLRQSLSVIKMEGFRFWPRFGGGWSGSNGARFTWDTWWSGDIGLFGLRDLELEGLTPVIEAQYGAKWSQERIDAYALMAVATACLSDHAHLAFHEEKVWTTPVWTTAHEKAVHLGVAGGSAEITVEGVWKREYANGRVVVNPTSTPFGNCAAHSAQIVVNA